MASAHRRGKTWYASYRDERGRWVSRSCGRGATRQDAIRRAARLDAEAYERRKGWVDPRDERFATEGGRPIVEHLADFEGMLRNKGDSVGHARLAAGHLRRIVRAIGASHLADLQPEAIRSAIMALHQPGHGRKRGLCLRTCSAILRSCKTFTRWLVADGRLRFDPLAHVQGWNADTDRRRVRRDLTGEELGLLLAVTYAGPVRFGLDGPTRAWAYSLAAATGLRRGELGSLTPRSFDLEADPPTVTVQAGYSKHRKEDRQPIDPALAASLREWIEGRKPDRRLLPLPHDTGSMIRDDLAAARESWIAAAETAAERQAREESDFCRYKDGEGRFADFHSLRGWFTAAVVAQGASVSALRELARHRDARTTLKYYARARSADVLAAVPKLPAIPKADRSLTPVKNAAGDSKNGDAPTPLQTGGQSPHNGDLATALTLIAKAELNDAEKAAAVRRLLASTGGGS